MWDTQTGIGSPNWPWVSGMGFFIHWVEKNLTKYPMVTLLPVGCGLIVRVFFGDEEISISETWPILYSLSGNYLYLNVNYNSLSQKPPPPKYLIIFGQKLLISDIVLNSGSCALIFSSRRYRYSLTIVFPCAKAESLQLLTCSV